MFDFRHISKTTALIGCFALSAVATQAQAAPRQIVIVVAEGLSPQVVDLGSQFVKTPATDDLTSNFDALKVQAKTAAAPANALESMRGLLKTASQNGFKTGLVTTGQVGSVAPLFYDLPATTSPQDLLGAKFDFLGGGGRASFVPTQTNMQPGRPAFQAPGVTPIFDVETFEATDQDLKGRVLALQSDADLTYASDRDAADEAGLSDLTNLAMEVLGRNNAPFVLVVHDTLLAKAIAAKDTPAMFGQFRELDDLVGNVLSAREDNPNLVMALLATGGDTTPRLNAQSPDERSNALFIASGLPLSYSKAGQTIAAADDEALQEFSDEQYKGFTLSPSDRAAIQGGTLTGEAAIRAAYEPALRLSYEAAPASATFYTVGLTGADPLQELTTLVGAAPAAASPMAPAMP